MSQNLQTAIERSRAPRPRLGRPTAAEAAEISRAILAAARDRFLEAGYEGATMDDIAERAGVPKSTLYKRHGDKLSLLRHVIRERIAAVSEVSSANNASLPDDPEARLKKHAIDVLTSPASEEIKALAHLAKGNWEGAAEVAALVHQMGYMQMVDYLETEIAAHSDRAGGAPRDSRSVAVALMSQLSGWLENRPPGSKTPHADAIAFAERAVELLIGGRAVW